MGLQGGITRSTAVGGYGVAELQKTTVTKVWQVKLAGKIIARRFGAAV